MATPRKDKFGSSNSEYSSSERSKVEPSNREAPQMKKRGERVTEHFQTGKPGRGAESPSNIENVEMLKGDNAPSYEEYVDDRHTNRFDDEDENILESGMFGNRYSEDDDNEYGEQNYGRIALSSEESPISRMLGRTKARSQLQDEDREANYEAQLSGPGTPDDELDFEEECGPTLRSSRMEGDREADRYMDQRGQKTNSPIRTHENRRHH